MMVSKDESDTMAGEFGIQPQRQAAEIDSAPENCGESCGELDLAGLSNAVGYVLRRAQLAVFANFIRRFADLDLKPAQYSVLLVIRNNPGRKQSEIAAALGIQRTNFVAMLDELEARGLAARARSCIDRRSHSVTLTEEGHALLARACSLQADQEREIAGILGPSGRDTLMELASRLTNLQ
ncbi:MAG: MarR family transcriptional regulator [Beijerinckiaceae bacterium]|jgi:DNA-binding MarR family transcriptional regulator